MVRSPQYSNRHINNLWVVYEIRTNQFVKWFSTQDEARSYSRKLNDGFTPSTTSQELKSRGNNSKEQ